MGFDPAQPPPPDTAARRADELDTARLEGSRAGIQAARSAAPDASTLGFDAVLALPGQEETGAGSARPIEGTLPFGATLPLPLTGGEPAPAGEAAVGFVLPGGFTLVRALGEDGACAWFTAEHPLHGPCLVRLLLPAAERALGKQLLLEARVLHLLPATPGLQRVLGLGTTPRPWVALASVLGRPLGEAWQEQRPTPRELALRFAELAGALEVAHTRRAYHGDILRDDVVVEDPSGRLVLTGFTRRARITPLGARAAFLGGPVLGAPNAVAPERFEDDRPTAAADLYALGCLLFEAVTGAPPYPGDDPHPVRLAALAGLPPAPPPRRDREAAALLAVATRCLATSPQARYATAAELEAALRRVAAPPRRWRLALLALALALAAASCWLAWWS